LDTANNGADAAVISAPESRVTIRVIKTNEDLMIARHVLATLGWAKA
jgi:acetate kinase